MDEKPFPFFRQQEKADRSRYRTDTQHGPNYRLKKTGKR